MGLYTELAGLGGLRGEGEEANFMDKVFDNSMNRLVHETDTAFGEKHFHDGLKSGWFEFDSARNVYRD
jgi:leucyl-tRNA synthetase